MKITELKAERTTYEVQSDSGKTYTVTYCGSGDADPEYVAIWKCTCPARVGTCKHINAVSDRIDDEYNAE